MCPKACPFCGIMVYLNKLPEYVDIQVILTHCWLCWLQGCSFSPAVVWLTLTLAPMLGVALVDLHHPPLLFHGRRPSTKQQSPSSSVRMDLCLFWAALTDHASLSYLSLRLGPLDPRYILPLFPEPPKSLLWTSSCLFLSGRPQAHWKFHFPLPTPIHP